MSQNPRLFEAREPLSYNLTTTTLTPPLEGVPPAHGLTSYLWLLVSYYDTMSLCKLLLVCIAVK